MREPPNIAEERLRACLREHYGLPAVTLEFLPRGRDYNAGVYWVVSEQGAAYLLKVTSRPLPAPSFLVPRALHDQGITAVVAPVPTRGNALWARLAEWTVIVYPWISGDSSLTGMTPALWRETGAIFKRIHQAQLPPDVRSLLRAETFDPSEYSQWERTFGAQHLRARDGRDGRDGESGAVRALRAAWAAHQPTIHAVAASLETLAAALQLRPLPYVICHADLHPANLLRDTAGRVFVIDWDEVMLAPKERDFIFVREPQAAAFWDGYGQEAIDWVALTYFRWERVMQDLIEDARLVFRDDLGEDTRADAARAFATSFAPGNNAAAAYAAAAHLPGDLTMSIPPES
jgi:spectinomycin phosphotransferase